MGNGLNMWFSPHRHTHMHMHAYTHTCTPKAFLPYNTLQI